MTIHVTLVSEEIVYKYNDGKGKKNDWDYVELLKRIIANEKIEIIVDSSVDVKVKEHLENTIKYVRKLSEDNNLEIDYDIFKI